MPPDGLVAAPCWTWGWLRLGPQALGSTVAAACGSASFGRPSPGVWRLKLLSSPTCPWSSARW
eukprot:13108822-Alexandrium_andersonii.AAC.1